MPPKNLIRRIGILTGGGDCPGLNVVIRAVVKSAAKRGIQCRGILDGYKGLVLNEVRSLSTDDVSGILTQGGTILGSSNKDDPFHFMETRPNGTVARRDRTADILETIKWHALDALVVLGGDGTMTVADKLVRKGVKIVGVPKTIDNDLVGTDQTFGFDTAVSTATEAIDRLHSTAASHHRVMVVEVMGRYAGWLALASGLAGGGDVILVPEFPYSEKKVAEAIEARHANGRKFSIVVVGEGAHPAGGKMVIDKIRNDSPEKIRLGGIGKFLADRLEASTGVECRTVVLGHVVRGGTPVASDRNLATRYGVEALEMVVDGKFGRMVALKNNVITSVPLSAVGGRTRNVTMNHPLVVAAKSIGITFGQ
jgi:6-phosphofructokinase 1